MSRLARKFNYGTEIKNVNDTLYNQLNDSYYSTALVVNTKATRMVSNFDAPAKGKKTEVWAIFRLSRMSIINVIQCLWPLLL